MTVITVSKPGFGHRDYEAYDLTLNPTTPPVLGDAVYINSSKQATKSNAGAAGTAKFAGVVISVIDQTATVMKRGFLAGFDVSALAVGAKLYLSDTAGKLDTAAGTVSLAVGVVAVLGDSKVAYINADWLNTIG